MSNGSCPRSSPARTGEQRRERGGRAASYPYLTPTTRVGKKPSAEISGQPGARSATTKPSRISRSPSDSRIGAISFGYFRCAAAAAVGLNQQLTGVATGRLDEIGGRWPGALPTWPAKCEFKFDGHNGLAHCSVYHSTERPVRRRPPPARPPIRTGALRARPGAVAVSHCRPCTSHGATGCRSQPLSKHSIAASPLPFFQCATATALVCPRAAHRSSGGI